MTVNSATSLYYRGGIDFASVSPSLARILGWLSGDGYVRIRPEKGKQSSHYEIGFFPDNRGLADLFSVDFEKEFRVKPHIHDPVSARDCFRVGIADVKACQSLLSTASFGHIAWRLPSSYTPQEHIEWIRAFLDCEAHVNVSARSIQAKSVNLDGLKQIHMKLAELGVHSQLYGPYSQRKPNWSPYLVLNMRGVRTIREYSSMIGFNHPAKIRALLSISPVQPQYRLTHRRFCALPG